MTGLPTGAEPREQLWSLWQRWMNWMVSYPQKRRALAQLGVSGEITPERMSKIVQELLRHANMGVYLKRQKDRTDNLDAIALDRSMASFCARQ